MSRVGPIVRSVWAAFNLVLAAGILIAIAIAACVAAVAGATVAAAALSLYNSRTMNDVRWPGV